MYGNKMIFIESVFCIIRVNVVVHFNAKYENKVPLSIRQIFSRSRFVRFINQFEKFA